MTWVYHVCHSAGERRAAIRDSHRQGSMAGRRGRVTVISGDATSDADSEMGS